MPIYLISKIFKPAELHFNNSSLDTREMPISFIVEIAVHNIIYCEYMYII